MTSATITPIETISPQFGEGDRVQFQGRTGTITRVYRNSGAPLWYGTRRIIHTHCYEIQTSDGPTWGWVETELSRANA